MICPRCNCSDRIANPFQLPPGFRVVLYNHEPFYKDRAFYNDTIRKMFSREERLASRDAALLSGHLYDAFLDNFLDLVGDLTHAYREFAVGAYNRCHYNHGIAEILVGRYSRFCFFMWQIAPQKWGMFVCCHEHL